MAEQDSPPILSDDYKKEYAARRAAPTPTPAEVSQFKSSTSFADRMARNQLPAENPLTERFQGGAKAMSVSDASRLATGGTDPRLAYDPATGTTSNVDPSIEPTPIRSVPPSAPTNLQDRARQNLQRALDGMSGLLGRPVTNPVPPAQQAPRPMATPNILTTIPRLAPITTPPATPIGTPVSSPTPFSSDAWLAGQNSKGK